ncbi:MAG: FAD:protein FMN transferase [Planctomycetota bacterium]|jgi:thiamine biosynthesis lipoprotein
MQESSREKKIRPSRRDLLALGAGAFVVATVPFALSGRRRRLFRRTIPLMGTLAEVGVVHADKRYAQAVIDAAFDRLRWVDGTMTRFSATSDVGRANRAATGEAVTISQETAHVLMASLDWAQATDGIFDPCLGKVVELWDVTGRIAPVPVDESRRFAARGLYRSLDLDGQSLVLRSEDAAIDLGGIAKGYGVDLAVETLREWGISSGLVNVGGDLYALGESEDGDPWKVGVRSPTHPDRIDRKLEVSDEAVATSGDYQQYFKHEGRTYHHLLDSATGAPHRTEVHSVTVIAADCVTADAAATAAFGNADERVLQQRGVRWA